MKKVDNPREPEACHFWRAPCPEREDEGGFDKDACRGCYYSYPAPPYATYPYYPDEVEEVNE